MKPLDKRLGRVIRAARDRRGFTQEELANRCGISRRHVAGIERGGNFTVAVLVEIASELTQIAPVIAEFLALAANRTSPGPTTDRSSVPLG
jgi:transcriptional regulator with XRE-family HTH domain